MPFNNEQSPSIYVAKSVVAVGFSPANAEKSTKSVTYFSNPGIEAVIPRVS